MHRFSLLIILPFALLIAGCAKPDAPHKASGNVLYDEGNECPRQTNSDGAACSANLIRVKISLPLPSGWSAWQGGGALPVTSKSPIIGTQDRVEDGCRMRVVLGLANGESTRRPMDFARLGRQRPELSGQKPMKPLTSEKGTVYWSLGPYGINGQRRFGEFRAVASGPRLSYKGYSWYPLWRLAANPIREDDQADQSPNNERCDWDTRQWQDLTLRELVRKVKLEVVGSSAN